MIHTSGQSSVGKTQWSAIESNSIDASAIGLSLTAMPRFILFGDEKTYEIIAEPIIQKNIKRKLTHRERLALLDDEYTLKKLYAEFAEEDKQLANIGINHYVSALEYEERAA